MDDRFSFEQIDLGISRPMSARILLAQVAWDEAYWIDRDGLAFHTNESLAGAIIDRILAEARQAAVDLVVFPELSVPESAIRIAQSWSEQTGAIVIAGSHYYRLESGFVARCPVIVGGKVFFTEKINPSPAEVSPIVGRGLHSGRNVVTFRNSAVGNFGVLICSDYLDSEVKTALIRNIDLLCVPAFQRDSTVYHSRMSIDCEESLDGLYIAYANTLCGEYGDGRSAIFGQMDNIFLDKLKAAGHTDRSPTWKLIELNSAQSHVIFEIDLRQKKPFAKRTVHTLPNVRLIAVGGVTDAKAERFLAAIGSRDERYARIQELFVPPQEYETIQAILDEKRLVFIVGDPGIGKTYTAISLLRDYSDKGFDPIWYAGLERMERLNQRRILEDFRPQAKQVVYFEDPFGRTVFEKRDTIRRVFGPLIDHLREADARVIITSRREIFEQFAQEVVSSVDLSVLTQELNVVKPSYSSQALVKILHKLADRAEWYRRADCREAVVTEIEKGRLATPLAIRDFVFSTEQVSSPNILLERLGRRGVEERELFSEEIEACNITTKLALSLVFLCPGQSLATLANWFNQIASFIEPGRPWNGTAPFFEVLRAQSGYRIEQYGVKASVLRFAHPYYEEAFAATALMDVVTNDLAASVMKFVARQRMRTAVLGLMRHGLKYPELTVKLLREIAPVMRSHGGLTDLSSVGLRLLDLFRITSDERFLAALRSLCAPEDVAQRINTETDVFVIGQGMRFLFNCSRLWAERRIDLWTNHESAIDWPGMTAKWEREPIFSKVISAMEWSVLIDPRKVRHFIERLVNRDELVTRATSVSFDDRRRLVRVLDRFGGGYAAVRSEIQRADPELVAIPLTRWVSQRADRTRGVVIDRGAANAIALGHGLLPVGVVRVVGDFQAHEPITIFDEDNNCIATSMLRYSSDEVESIRGHHSSMIADILGYGYVGGKGLIVQRSCAFEAEFLKSARRLGHRDHLR